MTTDRASRVTAADVARVAGVSQSTVSLVVNDRWHGRVGQAAVERILDIAERMGYRPNVAARILRRGVTGAIALAVPTLTNPFFGTVHGGAARVGEAHGLGLTVFPVTSDDDHGPFTSPHQAIDGVLACSLSEQKARELSAGLPLVLLDAASETGVPSVTFDLDRGVAEAIGHLYALGHRRVLHVRGDRDAWTLHRRAAAFDNQVARRPGMLGTELRCSFHPPEAAETVRVELARHPRPTAALCDDDNLAVAVYSAAARLGLAVPHDLSVIGTDDLPVAAVTTPPLTTIGLSGHELGRLGMQACIDLRDGRPTPSVILPASLRIRASTAPPPQPG
ncbi:LacI family DNA-binding transcriptional regulator [Micromonospora sp. NPDC000207]|uniref:LacI family DNA-binding transcriptional regulator n=1 Tax=Micromonospora sp. NPDC000207 TaxID=3154246 RepID=UPI00332BDF9D